MPDSPPIAEVTIDSLGGLGDGIATWNGQPLFVPKACAGDRLRVRVVHHNHQGYQGQIEQVIAPGPARVVAPCPHFGQCGGCRLQQLAPEEYRAFKTRMLRSALRQASCPDESAQVAFVGEGARRRVEFKLVRGGQGAAIAFHALRSNEAIAIDSCLLLEPALEALIAPLNEKLAAAPYAANVKSIAVTAADSGIDMVLSMGAERLPDSAALKALATACGAARLSVRLKEGAPQGVAKNAPVTMRLGGYDIALPPDAFLQATREGQARLTQIAVEAAQGARAVADLFCGIGTYSFPLSQSADVLAVEGDAAMVDNLRHHAKRYAIASLTAQRRDLFKHPLTAKELSRFEAAIINPPRAGAKAQVEQLRQANVPTIVMISCNPATFARDARMLIEGGYRIERAQGIDQFVWSQHLEIAAIFRK